MAIGGSLDVYVLPSGEAEPRRLTTTTLDEFSPSWSPGGRSVAYRVNPRRSDVGDIWVMRADGRGKRNLTRSPRVAEWSPAWSPDGRRIAYYSSLGMDVWVMRADGSRRRNLTRRAGLDEYPSWSPDGRRLAFGSHRDGQFEIYAMRADGSRQVNLTRNAASGSMAGVVPRRPDDRVHVRARRKPGRVRDGARRFESAEPHRGPALEESHPAWCPDGRLTFTRHGETGPIEVWAVGADGRDAEKLDLAAEPVFVYAWKPAAG